MTLEEHLVQIDGMLARGELSDDDHALARARAKAATRRGQPLPPLPGPSRFDDRRSGWRVRRQARAERHATGMTRADQHRRDAVDQAVTARDDEVARLRAVADRARAEGRMSAVEHAETQRLLDRRAREPVRPERPPPPRDRLARFATAFDDLGDIGSAGAADGGDGGADGGAGGD